VFTGIVEEVGTVKGAQRRGELVVLEIGAAATLAGLPIGGSVSVSGCCLTAVRKTENAFVVELTPETLARTRFGEGIAPGMRVNLERPMRADGRFDGHIVQGHVDGLGRVVDLVKQGESAELVVSVSPGRERYLVDKGSIAVEGVSLTVSQLRGASFGVALIPFTLSHTNLSGLRAGDAVNLEFDVIAKYVERLLGSR
jgi:riboflavin synthase